MDRWIHGGIHGGIHGFREKSLSSRWEATPHKLTNQPTNCHYFDHYAVNGSRTLMSWLNAVAPRNMNCILVALVVFQLLMSWLKEEA